MLKTFQHDKICLKKAHPLGNVNVKISMKKIFTSIFNIIIFFSLHGQSTDSVKTGILKCWVFADIYYAYDFNQPSDRNRPGFIYSHNKHNDFALNNGIIGLKCDEQNFRAALAFHTGTFIRANYANEPDFLRLIYEASIGFKVKKKLWIDAGIIPSHIGVESALSIYNPTLSRSMMAENTPYYDTGIKITYEPSKRFTLTGLILNGWQNIAENNTNKALGWQLQYKPMGNLLFNSSTFFGKETAAYDSISSMRYFHNFYTQAAIKNFTITAAFDIGFQNIRHSNMVNIWYNPTFIMRYNPVNKIAIAVRIEYYQDRKGVIILTDTKNGFQVYSSSLNFDVRMKENLLWRIEGRLFRSQDPIFIFKSNSKDTDLVLLSSLAVKF